jgi:lysozyme family protein
VAKSAVENLELSVMPSIDMLRVDTPRIDNFADAFNFTIRWYTISNEGGYEHDPADMGGETKYGISKRSYPDLDIKSLTLDDVRRIYYVDYWLKNKCDLIDNLDIASKLFDLSVNMGCRQAAIILQRALRSIKKRVIEDGIIGSETLNAVRDTLLETNKVDALLSAFKSEAAGHYRLIAYNYSQDKFLNGWLNRAYADCENKA